MSKVYVVIDSDSDVVAVCMDIDRARYVAKKLMGNCSLQGPNSFRECDFNFQHIQEAELDEWEDDIKKEKP